MAEQLVLGLVQGVTEWLPISSEGVFVLVKTQVFGGTDTLSSSIEQAIFLHLGTFAAAAWYLRDELTRLLKAAVSSQDKAGRRVLVFLLASTVVTGAVGVFLLAAVERLEGGVAVGTTAVMVLIGVLLLVTGAFQLKGRAGGYAREEDLDSKDSVLLGVLQGLAALPGLSRSGLTVSGLLLRRYDKVLALKLSFLMSLPAVLGGNVLLQFREFAFEPVMLAGLFSSFAAGLLTIHLLVRLAAKVNFGYFALAFGLLMIAAPLAAMI